MRGLLIQKPYLGLVFIAIDIAILAMVVIFRGKVDFFFLSVLAALILSDIIIAILLGGKKNG